MSDKLRDRIIELLDKVDKDEANPYWVHDLLCETYPKSSFDGLSDCEKGRYIRIAHRVLRGTASFSHQIHENLALCVGAVESAE